MCESSCSAAGFLCSKLIANFEWMFNFHACYGMMVHTNKYTLPLFACLFLLTLIAYLLKLMYYVMLESAISLQLL